MVTQGRRGRVFRAGPATDDGLCSPNAGPLQDGLRRSVVFSLDDASEGKRMSADRTASAPWSELDCIIDRDVNPTSWTRKRAAVFVPAGICGPSTPPGERTPGVIA